MADCCMDGNFCDFPWCDCTGNAEFRRLHKLVNREDENQDCGQSWCNTCRHARQRQEEQKRQTSTDLGKS